MPSNEVQRIQLGYNQYHCYQNAYLVDADSYLALDAAYGIESAIIMWGCTSPAFFYALRKCICCCICIG